MPNYTKNLGLTKPLPEEFYDVNVRNENWDKLDTAIGDLKDGIELPDGADLNDYKETGKYYKTHGADTLLNIPTIYGSITMTVERTGAYGVGVVQTIKDHKGNVYVRSYAAESDDDWTEWDDVITSRGGIMKSRLWFGNGVHNGYGGIASNKTEMHLTVFTDPTDDNSPYTNLVINNGEGVPDGQRLRVSIDSMDSDTSLRSYYLIHSGNINEYVSTSSAGLTPASIE